MNRHMAVRKAWITVDISEAGNAAPSSVAGEMSTLGLPKKPLASCKSCCSGKEYGSYYNTAAHLRRVHFNPQVQRKAGQPTKGIRRCGGNDSKEPPMETLRRWMREIEVVNHGMVKEAAQEDYPMEAPQNS
ncbi:hypothetical protein FGG08_001338 [Glutinoglossum americanum]|uniref:DUF7896 domain-containing protein n=1 Tax=Glutinoglossum americanum TaxID=1670608 RepID=A0A9P8IDS2_9PEZI|nr:hypothetical protein FGG08_001338 [Glutinoglossum americanum]